MIQNSMKTTFFAVALSFALGTCPKQVVAQQDGSSSAPPEGSDSHRSSFGLSPGGLFAEPILTYSQEQSTIKTSQLPVISDDTSGNTKGYGIGARLGFHASEIVFLAADGRYHRTNFSDSAYGKADGNAWNLGPTLGVQMPVFGLRVWGTYVTVGEFDPQAGNGDFDAKFRDPRGWRMGLGLRLAALSVNLEYEDLTYDKSDIESFGVINTSGSSDVDFNSNAAIVSISFPLQM